MSTIVRPDECSLPVPGDECPAIEALQVVVMSAEPVE